jgi:hypothetical protein
MANFISYIYSDFLFWLKNVGKREFFNKGRSYRFYYNFTKVTIIILPLTKALNCLIKRSITLYSNGI